MQHHVRHRLMAIFAFGAATSMAMAFTPPQLWQALADLI
jgi:hypothetical protein